MYGLLYELGNIIHRNLVGVLINKCYKNYSVQNCWSPLTVTIGARDQDQTNFACGTVGDQRKEVIADRREVGKEEKAEEKRIGHEWDRIRW